MLTRDDRDRDNDVYVVLGCAVLGGLIGVGLSLTRGLVQISSVALGYVLLGVVAGFVVGVLLASFVRSGDGE